MAQAKGILPRRDDREVLYKNPQTCGYFVSVKLDPGMDRARAEGWLEAVSHLVDELVARLAPEEGEEKGQKVAAVAVGLAPSFFATGGAPRFSPPVEAPAAFAAGVPLPNATAPLASVPLVDADVLFYVASVFEARVNEFVSRLAEMRPDVQAIRLERGYQRLDETEPFGYKDGVRNIRSQDRPEFVFVHRGGRELDEPVWADGGSYMAYMKILQRPDQFAARPDDATRDQVIGRTKDGTRLDLVGQRVDPKREPADPPPNLPPTAHVRKAGPRGMHDDTQIFRRGLPFIETTADGQVRVGLQFCSFQAWLDQFDVAFNDWMASRQFPPQPNGAEAGTDALLDPARQLTVIEQGGFSSSRPTTPTVWPPPSSPAARSARGQPAGSSSTSGSSTRTTRAAASSAAASASRSSTRTGRSSPTHSSRPTPRAVGSVRSSSTSASRTRCKSCRRRSPTSS